MTGHYRMHRGWLDHPALGGDREPYCRRAAWAWMIENACWRPTKVDAGGTTITVERGQLCYSYRFLAKTWGWSVGKVQLFFDRLKTDTMINTVVNTGRLVVTICNYDKYQAGLEPVNTPDNTVANTPSIRGQYEEEESKKGRKKSNRKDTCGGGNGKAPAPDPNEPELLRAIRESQEAEASSCPPPEPAPLPPTPTAPVATNVIPLKPAKAPLPADWTLPDDYRAMAEEVGHACPDLAARRFRNYWLERAEDRKPDAVKSAAGWKRAWDNWISKDVMKGDDHGRRDGQQGHREPGERSRDVWSRLASREAARGPGR